MKLPMNSHALMLCSVLGTSPFATQAFAGKGADLKPTVLQLGKPALEESFSDPLGKTWRVVKGDWTVTDGVLVGQEKKSDEHAAVLNCQLPNRDSAIAFSFKLSGTQSFNLSFNHAKGHLFRVIVNPKGLSISKDKDKKDPDSKVIALGHTAAKFKQDQWYTMLVEVKGPQVVAQVDDGTIVKGSHAELDTDKPNYRFVMRGATLQLDDVRVFLAKE